MEVVGHLEAVEARGAGRRPRPAVALVDQHQVQVAVIVHLPAAQLAQRQHHVAAGWPARSPPSRCAEALRQRSYCRGRQLPPGSSRPGRSGRPSSPGWRPCPGCRGRRCAAAPCPGSCAGSAPGRRRRGTARPARSRNSSAPPRLVQHQAVEQLVDHAGVVDEDLGEELAPGAQIDVELQARRVETEQLPQHRLAPERAVTFSRLSRAMSGSGVSATARSKVGAMLARKCRQRRVDRNGDRLLGQLHEVVIGALHVAERDNGRARSGWFPDRDWCRGSGRIPARPRRPRRQRSDAADDRGCAGSARSCPIIARKAAQDRARGSPPAERSVRRRVAHAQRKLAQLLLAFGQTVRLQVEEQLQPVLGLAQEAIGVVEDAVFLVGQAADPLQGGSASRVLRWRTSGRSPPLRSCKNWMVNSMSRMPPRPVLTSLLLAPAWLVFCSMRRLIALISLISAKREIFAVDKRFDGLQEAAAPSARSPATGRTLISACRSQVRPMRS